VLEKTESISSIRSLVSAFIDDLIVSFNCAQFPIVDDFLYFSCALFTNVSRNPECSQNSRAVCIEALGRICSVLSQEIENCRNNPFLLNERSLEFNPEATAKDEIDRFGCPCKKLSLEEFMLDCDDCHFWFHGKCVGIKKEQMSVLSQTGWICSNCAKLRLIDKEKVIFPSDLIEGKNESVNTVSETDEVLRKFFLNFLTLSAKSNVTYLYSRQYFLARWLLSDSSKSQNDEGSVSRCNAFLERNWNVSLPSIGEQLPVLTRNSSKLMCQIGFNTSPIFKSYEILLQGIVYLMDDKNASFRVKAIKSLRATVELDVSILQRPVIQKSLRMALVDKSPSVRESVIDLIGKYSLKAELMKSYYDIISFGVQDKSLSVRKRAIQIMKDICISCPNHPNYSEFCALLIKRMDDESTIKESVVRTFEQMWFSDSNLILIADHKKTSFEYPQQFRQIVTQILNTVNQIDNTDLLAKLLRDIFQSDRTNLTTLFLISGAVVTCLVGLLLNFEEGLKGEHVDHSNESQALGCISTIEAFASVYPSLVVEHIEILAPYLKGLDGCPQNADFLYRAISIISMCFPLTQNPRKAFVAHVERDLTQIICSKPIKIAKAAIPCLCIVARKVSQAQRSIIALFNAFWNKASSFQAQAKHESSQEDSICRCIFSIGLLIKFFDLDSLEASSGICLFGSESAKLEGTFFHFFSFFCAFDSAKIRAYAIEAMFNFFSRYPRQMIVSEAIVNNLLNLRENQEVLLYCLGGLFDFLKSEEQRLQYSQFLQSNTKSSKVVMEGSTDLVKHTGDFAYVSAIRQDCEEDSAIISGMIQRYLQNLTSLCYSASPLVRKKVLDILILLFQQLRTNPQLSVPSIILLCVDQVDVIRESALSIFSTLSIKYFSILLSSVFFCKFGFFYIFPLLFQGNVFRDCWN
jgi:cohesin loading factor subunit SCC2